ncbi:hypothetical protein MesoLj113b_10610 [Mesorhizobium sp. 113-3-3]|nr:hypothetical protein MesoLj113b_10610 [Mesorhizobium sp. 113-3-3]
MPVVQPKDDPAGRLADERKHADLAFRRRVGVSPAFQPKWPDGKVAQRRKPADPSRCSRQGAFGRAHGGQCKTIGCQHVPVGELSAGKNAFGIGKGLCSGRHIGKSLATNDSIGWFGSLRGETPPARRGLVEDFRKAGYTVTAVN